jgi:hypothetical protein
MKWFRSLDNTETVGPSTAEILEDARTRRASFEAIFDKVILESPTPEAAAYFEREKRALMRLLDLLASSNAVTAQPADAKVVQGDDA